MTNDATNADATNAEATSAIEIAAAVRSGERSAREVLEQHLAMIDEREAEIHAFNLVLADEARAQADKVDAAVASGEDPGPLAGVPVALKDNLCTRGIPTTCSSRILEGWQPPYDATVVTSLADSGAVFVGKTNLDEFAMGSSTENSAFGPTRNPLDPERVPGGSSGGSAAAVAAGFSALSIGSDTGGSIRQPAAYCGLVGVKPTYGLVSRYGLIAFGSSLDQIGPFANTVADAAVTLDVISGHDPRDSTSAPGAPASVTEALGSGVEGMRVGIVSELMGDDMDAECLDAVKAAAQALEAAGATIAEASIPAALYGLGAYYLIAPAEASSNLSRYDGVRYGMRVDSATTGAMNEATRTSGFGDEVKRRIMLGTYALSAGYYDAYYGSAQKVRTLLTREFDAAYNDFDLLLSPTTPTTAFKFGDKADPVSMYLCDLATIPTNLTGHAAMSVPFGFGANNMPIGVQILAPALGEVPMFQAAEVLEAAAPTAGGAA